ncbi:hypothetical protein DAI22_07g166800 [Oryza sativa Japonica Group]|nr:hypothetical protein DAI22_07g166800 [Oryza sativa Japonica Group]
MQKTRRCGAMLPCKEEVFVNHNTWAPINHPLERIARNTIYLYGSHDVRRTNDGFGACVRVRACVRPSVTVTTAGDQTNRERETNCCRDRCRHVHHHQFIMPTFACNFNAAIGAGICFFLRKFAASLTMYVHPELPAGKHIYILPLNFVEIITEILLFLFDV